LVSEVVEPVAHELLHGNALALAHVSTRVVLECALLVERLAAEARERAAAGVDQRVTVELGLALKPRAAVDAHVLALACVTRVGRRADGAALASG